MFLVEIWTHSRRAFLRRRKPGSMDSGTVQTCWLPPRAGWAISIADSSKCRAASGAGLSQAARPGVHLRRRCLGLVMGWIRFAATHPLGLALAQSQPPRSASSSKGSAYLRLALFLRSRYGRCFIPAYNFVWKRQSPRTGPSYDGWTS